MIYRQLGALAYVALGWAWCYWNLQRFFDRLKKAYPRQPRREIGWDEVPLFALASIPLWPLVALGIAAIDPFIDEPVGTKSSGRFQ